MVTRSTVLLVVIEVIMLAVAAFCYYYSKPSQKERPGTISESRPIDKFDIGRVEKESMINVRSNSSVPTFVGITNVQQWSYFQDLVSRGVPVEEAKRLTYWNTTGESPTELTFSPATDDTFVVVVAPLKEYRESSYMISSTVTTYPHRALTITFLGMAITTFLGYLLRASEKSRCPSTKRSNVLEDSI